jgi:peptidoglycan/xylan/chitin deacetylase (PgdA/CDA1 family)
VIHQAIPQDLAPAERYGLEALVDLSRLLVVTDPAADVVQLEVVDAPATSLDDLLTHDFMVERRDGVVRVSRPALAAVTDIAGAGVEQASRTADRHGRVPSTVNPLVRSGTERQPIVQRWAATLDRAVREAAGRRPLRFVARWPEGRRWAVALTHDLDVVSGWPVFTVLRAAELARGGEWRRLTRSFGAALRAIGRHPVQAGIHELLAAERAAGIRSTWFVLCATPTARGWLAGDVTYALESPPARRLLDAILAGGHEVGLHGSFVTALDGARLREERDHLMRLLGVPPAGVRQHFLRMRPGRTQALAAAAGFSYDATFGFADRNGFRTGVADILPAWDTVAALPLDIAPLVWMDRALSKYRGIQDPEAWITDALELAVTTRDAGGLWVGLWHPNLTPALGFPGAPEAFRRLLRGLAADAPLFAPLDPLVTWRRARRTTRATRLAPDGRLEITAGTPAAWPVALEDEQGRAVHHG